MVVITQYFSFTLLFWEKEKKKEEDVFDLLSPRLVCKFKCIFSVFKQYYPYFHTFFHQQIFSKKLKTVV